MREFLEELSRLSLGKTTGEPPGLRPNRREYVRQAVSRGRVICCLDERDKVAELGIPGNSPTI